MEPFMDPPGSWSWCHCRMSTLHTACYTKHLPVIPIAHTRIKNKLTNNVTTTNSSANALTMGLKYASRWKYTSMYRATPLLNVCMTAYAMNQLAILATNRCTSAHFCSGALAASCRSKPHDTRMVM